MYSNDHRTVLTLDAGGTNLVFSAIQSNKVIAGPITKPSYADHLDRCLASIVDGFTEIMNLLKEPPVAISFAFPGPADYPNGIIDGFLHNFPSFRQGVALGPFLERQFKIPVFINNDADLFTYGEALAGALSEINRRLSEMGSIKQYHNLIGFTWGTGFGFGFTVNREMHMGDNCCSEIFCLPQIKQPDIIVEDGVSVRAIKRVYAERSGVNDSALDPFAIFQIAEGVKQGDQQAAIDAFAEFGTIAGDAIANAMSLIDGIVVIGGGLTKAHHYIMPSLLNVLRSQMRTLNGQTLNRLQTTVYDLDNEEEFLRFAKEKSKTMKIYGSEETITYDPDRRVGVIISKIGTSHAVSLGAYNFALNQLDK